MKRERPSWDEFFMLDAIKTTTRSSCVYLQTGAVIVKDKRVIATGYNGAPPNIKNCLERGCRKDRERINFDDKGKGVCRGVHAEYNAMCQRSRDEVKGTTIYSVYCPCSACAKQIVGNGLSRVVFLNHYQEPDSLTTELFEEAKIELVHFNFNGRLNYFLEQMRKIACRKLR